MTGDEWISCPECGTADVTGTFMAKGGPVKPKQYAIMYECDHCGNQGVYRGEPA